MIDAKHLYLQNDTRLMGTIREDLKDFPLIRGHFYNFEEEPDPETSQANILWCFKNIIQMVDRLIQLNGQDELAKEFECNEPEDDGKKKVKAYSSGKYSLILFMLD